MIPSYAASSNLTPNPPRIAECRVDEKHHCAHPTNGIQTSFWHFMHRGNTVAIGVTVDEDSPSSVFGFFSLRLEQYCPLGEGNRDGGHGRFGLWSMNPKPIYVVVRLCRQLSLAGPSPEQRGLCAIRRGLRGGVLGRPPGPPPPRQHSPAPRLRRPPLPPARPHSRPPAVPEGRHL